VNGLARVIRYKKIGTNKKMIDFFEGKMDKGYPAGFVRYMTEERNDMFFGQLN